MVILCFWTEIVRIISRQSPPPFLETNNLNLTLCHQALPLHKLSITEKVVQAVQSMLLPQEGSLSIHTSLPATGDGSAPVMAVVRLLAEIRTRWARSKDPLMYWGGAGHRQGSVVGPSMKVMPRRVTEAILLCPVYYSFCCISQFLQFLLQSPVFALWNKV